MGHQPPGSSLQTFLYIWNRNSSLEKMKKNTFGSQIRSHPANKFQWATWPEVKMPRYSQES